MNCHEVMELMQRQLDEELSQAEREIWTAHSKQCPDCAEKFELLKLISLELTSLPKVTPRYSLVDAIMPELDRLDNLKKHENTPAITPSQAIPNKTKSKFSWRALSGVIAAAAVCGIFIATYPYSSGAKKSNDVMPIAANMQGSRVAPETLEAPFAASNNSGNNKAGEVGAESYSVEKNTESSQNTEQTKQAVSDRLPEDPIKGLSNDENQMSRSQNESGAETSKSDTSRVTGHVLEQNSNKLPFNHSSLSPNEQLVASVINYSVVVQNASRDYVIMETDRKNGKLMNFVWSEDSKKLTYEVHLDQGAIITYVIDLEQMQEHRAKP